jgi:hypothetical protein
LLHVCSDVPVRPGSTRYPQPAPDTCNRTERQVAACIFITWYVAIAEALDAPLATLDGRLATAAGPRCQFLVTPTVT